MIWMTLWNNEPSPLTIKTTQRCLGIPHTNSKADQLILIIASPVQSFHKPLFFLPSFVFKDKSPLLSFPHISRIEACQCHPGIVYVVLAPCWAHYWFLEVARLHLGCWYRSLLCPTQTSISVLRLILRHLDYIFIFRSGAWSQPPSLLGRVTFLLLAAEPLPNYSDYCWWNGCATWWLVIWPIILNEAPQREG